MKNHLTWVVLALLLGGLAYWASETRVAQLANLRIPQHTFPEVYLQMDIGSSSKCLVSGRAGTTRKRSDQDLAKASWRCRLETPVGMPPVFVVDSKRYPSYLFAPFTAVTDLAYPMVYEEVRAGEALALPDLHWVHLYFNRQFQGLYLEISLPGRHFAAQRLEAALARSEAGLPTTADGDNESGNETVQPEHLEVLAVNGPHLVCFDRKMRPTCPIYNLAVADGVFPRPKISSGIAFLQHLSPPPAHTFILSDRSYDLLEPFPIPVDLRDLLTRQPYIDQRYRRWQEPVTPPTKTEEYYAHLFANEKQRTTTHLRHLADSIRTSCVVMGCDAAQHIDRVATGATGRWLEDT